MAGQMPRGDSTKMPSFGPPTLSHQQIEELSQYLASLQGGPGSTRKPEIHDTFPAITSRPQ